MSEEDKLKMWGIDAKLVLGNKISDAEKQFYNSNLENMIICLESEYNHWKHHCRQIEK